MNKEYKIATWCKVNNDGDNSFLSRTHLTIDGETAICGTKIPLKRGQEQFIVVGKPQQFVGLGPIFDGELFYHNGGRADLRDMAWDLKEATCCSGCQKKSGGLLAFAVDSIVSRHESADEAREVARQARIAARKEKGVAK